MYTKLYESISKARYDDSPWEHHTFGQALTEAQVDEIRSAVIPRKGILHDGTRSGYKEGVEKQKYNRAVAGDQGYEMSTNTMK